ncbi:MAG: TlpA family protein disulfide reductase [Acidobacteria bacterium]|nr:TlpA family protein disulfide reductase [Acidobacteriota bacterium]
MMTRWWQSRWIRAAAVAAVLGAWPACAAKEQRAPSAGSPRLDFVLKDMNGQDVKLADLKGRPILINFWATWCPPCKAEIPWFVEFAEKYKDKRLAVLGVSVDDPPEEIRKFAAEYEINYPMLVGDGQDEFKAAYDAEAVIPVSWLIKPDGTLLAKAQGIHAKEWFEENIGLMFEGD